MKASFYLVLISFMLLGMPVALGQTTYYLKNNGDHAISKETADFTRIVSDRNEETVLYPMKELYLNGAVRSTAHSYRKDLPVYHGAFTAYFESGIKKQQLNYVRGIMVDTAMHYYPNGKLYQFVRHPKFGDSSLAYVETVNDSAGTALVKNGNGQAVIYDADFKYITAQGNIKDGTYDGAWTGEIRSDAVIRYKEIYENGKLLSGQSVDEQGNSYQYTESEVKPTFEGGIKNFYLYVIRNVRYPAQLASKRIPGVAQISFVVLKNGKVTDAQAINDVHPALAAEAIRILKGAKGWIPGRRKGKPVDMAFVMPFTFNIAY